MATQTIGGVSLSHQLLEAATYFSETMYRRMINTSLWASGVEKMPWPDGESDLLSVATYERVLPNAPMVWNPVNSDSSTFAVPSAVQVGIAQTIRQFGLSHAAVESIPISVNDVRFTFKTQQQMQAVFENLTENVKRIWELRNRDEYRRLCGTKYIVGNAGSAVAPATPALVASTGDDYPTNIAPGSGGASIGILTQGFLDRVRQQLTNDGAATDPMARANGRPLFTVIAGSDALDGIIRIDPSIREDFRNANQIDELFKPIGVERAYRGWLHVPDDMAPRYGYYDGSTATPAPITGSATIRLIDSMNGVYRFTFSATGVANLLSGQNFDFLASNANGVVRGKILTVESATQFLFQAQSVGTVDAALNLATTAGTPGTNLYVFRLLNRDWSATQPQGFVETPFFIPATADLGATITGQGRAQTVTSPSGTASTVNARRWVPNPAYASALYEEGFVFHKGVYKAVIPNPFTSAGAGTRFNAKTYTGKFDFINEFDRVANPDKSWGYYRGVVMSGSMPCKPYWGAAFIYRRYETPGSVVTIPTYAATTGITAGAAITDTALD